MVITSLLLPSFVFLTLYPLPPPVKDSRRILILLHLILLLLPLIPILSFSCSASCFSSCLAM